MKRLETVKESYTVWVDSALESGNAFWGKVGPILADKDIRKALGGFVDTNNDYLWFFILNDSQDIVAFSCLNFGKVDRGEVWFDNAYVYPTYRDMGLHEVMIRCRLAYAWEHGAIWVKAYARTTAYRALEDHGFTATGQQRGEYRTYIKEKPADGTAEPRSR